MQCGNRDAIIKVEFLRPYGLVYLDQIMLKDCEKYPTKKLYSSYPKANRYLKQCGFRHLKNGVALSDPFPQNYIIKIERFLKGTESLEEHFVDWVNKNVIQFIPKCSGELEKQIVEKMWEIVINAHRHSECKFGVSICGQFYPKKGYFEIAFFDCGYGIPTVVKRHKALKRGEMDYKCIEWAMKKGTSTKPMNEPSGLGLFLLREFIKINQGAFQISSGNGYFGNIDSKKPTKKTLKNPINGTLVNLRVIYDENIYTLV